jgi:hypothetical protein
MHFEIIIFLQFHMHKYTNNSLIAMLNKVSDVRWVYVHNKIFFTMVIMKQNWSRLFENNIKGTFVEKIISLAIWKYLLRMFLSVLLNIHFNSAKMISNLKKIIFKK